MALKASPGVTGSFDGYLFAFDPNMCNRHAVRVPKAETMYSEDLTLVDRLLQQLPPVPVVVQLSTYSANGGNAQAAVLASVTECLRPYDIVFTSSLHADQAMMSMIFARDITLPQTLDHRFQHWLAQHRFGPPAR